MARKLMKSSPGAPGFSLFKPGPSNGKRGIRRLMKRDPSDGLSMPEADRITDTHIDLNGTSARVISKGNDLGTDTGAGTRTISKPALGPLKRR